jgi:hypothetical protein
MSVDRGLNVHATFILLSKIIYHNNDIGSINLHQDVYQGSDPSNVDCRGSFREFESLEALKPFETNCND